ncbi:MULTISPECIES: hypothetical protein [unclassified Streptomyces]|uniref:hypothetical protein n=1 Tax=unclassified Streptomyces TaxID=2593676 RepID=UPI002E11CAFA|nr:hypothetical protein OG452_06175 [Streptomyces sp. NBC_01197]WSS52364.1 hypothetical protein OG708_29270 [Streptomyces sp. NBC_01180]
MTVYGRAIALLVDRPELAEVAAYSFGFDVAGAAHGAAVRLASGAPLETVAGDGTGGTFFVCGGGPVLYASGGGAAGLVAASADEALELAIGLPGWLGLLHLSPSGLGAALPAAAPEEAIRGSQPDLDGRRDALRGALGLPVRSPAELFARLHTALLRTEPDHLLLDTAGGRAFARLDPHPRTPLRQTVLSPGLADLARLRDDTAQWTEVAGDKARRATVLRAAQFDRQDGDLPLLRRLLAAETADTGTSEELRLAAVLVALHGSAEDLPLLRAARAAPQALRWGLPEIPERPGAFVEWARGLDGSHLGEDPAREPELTWIRLARRQGRTELARVALVRILDAAGEQTDLLRVLSVELEALGDLRQAARAQSGHAALVDEPRDQGVACRRLAELQRRTGDLPAAWRTLRPVPEILDTDGSERRWRRLGLGRMVAAEHFELALAAAGAGLTPIALESLAVARELHAGMGKSAQRSLGMLAQETKWAVARLK